MGLDGLKTAARVGGVKGDCASDTALKQVLQKHASASISGKQVCAGWSLRANDSERGYFEHID